MNSNPMNEKLDFVVRRDRLYEQVADQILELIIDDQISLGDRLPSERELAELLGVSRPVIREAIRSLGVRGVVAVKQGSGTFVTQPSASDVSASINLLLRLRNHQDSFVDLFEVRNALEVAIAGSAAVHATAKDIVAIEATIVGMERGGSSASSFSMYDVAYHDALAAATHNDLFALLLSPIADLLHDCRLVAFHHDADESLRGGLMHHREILDRIRRGDAEGARAAMGLHLEQARAVFEAHLESARTLRGNREGGTDSRPNQDDDLSTPDQVASPSQ
jgi:GntR family transcriptional repressor for pyruvate dehydrogenase complex